MIPAILAGLRLGHKITVGLRLHLILTAEDSLLKQVIALDTESSPNCAAVFAQSSSLSEKSGSPNKIFVVNFGHDKKIQNPKLRKNP